MDVCVGVTCRRDRGVHDDSVALQFAVELHSVTESLDNLHPNEQRHAKGQNSVLLLICHLSQPSHGVTPFQQLQRIFPRVALQVAGEIAKCNSAFIPSLLSRQTFCFSCASVSGLGSLRPVSCYEMG